MSKVYLTPEEFGQIAQYASKCDTYAPYHTEPVNDYLNVLRLKYFPSVETIGEMLFGHLPYVLISTLRDVMTDTDDADVLEEILREWVIDSISNHLHFEMNEF